MLEVADIFRLHGAVYRARFGDRLLASQKRAMRDIEACRTAYCGGHLKKCDRCGRQVYTYHSCGNRHCPKCHRHQTERWLEKQRARLLPCFYFLLTFTLPSELRALARAHPKKLYGLLLSCAAAALQKLCRDPRYLGARPGCLAVLHTWTRALLYHPHVHLLVTAGGLSADGSQWIPTKNPRYLVPAAALSILFRAKLCAALKQARLLDQVPRQVWKKDWVVDCKPAGSGRKVLEYLGRYVFRIAIANSRLEQIDNGQVTFRYRENRTQMLQRVMLPAVEFIGRFLQHVLPPGCVKVRHYGIWSNSSRRQLEQARALLDAPPPGTTNPLVPLPSLPQSSLAAAPSAPARCPHCRIGRLIVIEVLLPQRNFPP
jgi:hypothetical protein